MKSPNYLPALRREISSFHLLRWMEATGAIILFLTFFLPWLSLFGTNIPAHGIRENLEGAHRLASAFTAGSRISLDYHLSLGIYAIPVASALLFLLSVLNRPSWWAPLVTGTIALAVSQYLRLEVRDWPFVRLQYGLDWSIIAGGILLLLSLCRLVESKRFRIRPTLPGN